MAQLPPLVQACAKGDLSRTKRLLDDGEPVNNYQIILQSKNIIFKIIFIQIQSNYSCQNIHISFKFNTIYSLFHSNSIQIQHYLNKISYKLFIFYSKLFIFYSYLIQK